MLYYGQVSDLKEEEEEEEEEDEDEEEMRRRSFPRAKIFLNRQRACSGAAKRGRNLPASLRETFHAHGDPHSATDTEGSHSTVNIPSLHLEQKDNKNPSTGCADWMSESDGSAIHIQLVRIESKFFAYGAGLCGKCLIRLDQIDVI